MTGLLANSDKTVGTVRKELESTAEIPQSAVNSVHLEDRRIAARAPSPEAMAYCRRWTAAELRARAALAPHWADRAASEWLARKIINQPNGDSK